MYSAHKIRAVNQTSGVKKSHVLGHLRIFSLNHNLRLHSAPHKCPLTISKCPLCVLWRCLSYREFGYSKITEKQPGLTPGVCLLEVSVKRELTVCQPTSTLTTFFSLQYVPDGCCIAHLLFRFHSQMPLGFFSF